eukprot:2760060-Rhodomonas_salina.1
MRFLVFRVCFGVSITESRDHVPVGHRERVRVTEPPARLVPLECVGRGHAVMLFVGAGKTGKIERKERRKKKEKVDGRERGGRMR